MMATASNTSIVNMPRPIQRFAGEERERSATMRCFTHTNGQRKSRRRDRLIYTVCHAGIVLICGKALTQTSRSNSSGIPQGYPLRDLAINDWLFRKVSALVASFSRKEASPIQRAPPKGFFIP
jgi:hypothetical protein